MKISLEVEHLSRVDTAGGHVGWREEWLVSVQRRIEKIPDSRDASPCMDTRRNFLTSKYLIHLPPHPSP